MRRKDGLRLFLPRLGINSTPVYHVLLVEVFDVFLRSVPVS